MRCDRKIGDHLIDIAVAQPPERAANLVIGQAVAALTIALHVDWQKAHSIGGWAVTVDSLTVLADGVVRFMVSGILGDTVDWVASVQITELMQ